MKECPKCKEEYDKSHSFCSKCGVKLKTIKKSKKEIKKDKEEKAENQAKAIFGKISDNIEKILEAEDTTSDYKDEDIASYKGLALLSYIGPLALIPYLKGKEYKYSYFHAVQGMNLLLIWIIYTISAIIAHNLLASESCSYMFSKMYQKCVTTTPWWIKVPFSIVGFTLLILSIIGIIYALLGKAKKLPLIDKINIIK